MKKNLKQLKLKHFCKKQISSKSLTKTFFFLSYHLPFWTSLFSFSSCFIKMILRVAQHMFTLQKSWSKCEAKPILTQRVKQDIKKFWYSCVNACFTASLASHIFTQCLRLRLRLLLLLRLLHMHSCELGLNNISIISFLVNKTN